MSEKAMFGSYEVSSHAVSIKTLEQRMTIDFRTLPGAELLTQFADHGWEVEMGPTHLFEAYGKDAYCIWFVSTTPDPTQPMPVPEGTFTKHRRRRNA